MIAVRGAREHNLKNVDLDDPARPARGVHRPVGLGQIVARLRHDLRRGPAALRRVALGLCAPVPRDDAEARRRPDRRPLAGDLDRAEDDLEEPALDRRHRHRDLRLHAPALGAGRHPLLARDRPADREPDRAARWSTGCWRCRRRRGSTSSRRWCAAARASTARRSPSSRRRASSASRSTASTTPSTRPRPSTRSSSTTSTSWSTASWCAPTSPRGWRNRFETALELADGIAVIEYADETDEKGKPQRITFSSKFACPVSGFTIPEIEPRLFSFNNPFGACPTCGGIGHEMRIDAGLVVPDETPVPEARRHRALGEVHLALLRPDAGGHRQALQGVDDQRPGPSCPRRCAT